MNKKSKKYKYQSGGLADSLKVNPITRSNTAVTLNLLPLTPKPLTVQQQNMNAILGPSPYPANDSIDVAKAQAMYKLANKNPELIKDYYKTAAGVNTENLTKRRKASFRDRFIEKQHGGGLNEANSKIIDYVLPEFTVVSAKKDSPKRKTLEYLQKAEESMPGVNYYNAWSKSGAPLIEEGTNIFGRENYRSSSNTIQMKMETDTYANMPLSKRKLIEASLDKKIPIPFRTMDHAEMEREFLDNTLIGVRYKYPGPITFSGELAHSLQQKVRGKNYLPAKHVKDWVEDPFVTNSGQSRQYSRKGTAEYEAHTEIQPYIYRNIMSTPKAHKIDLSEYQHGGDIVSTMGYQDNSPFRNSPSLSINSPSISMANVSQPLIGISNQTGETKYMKPNKNYKFKNTQSVTEVPAQSYMAGGALGLAVGEIGRIGSGIGNLKQSMESGDFKDKNLLGKYADIAGALPGMGLISPLATQLANIFAKSSDKVISASPGNYQTGGDIPLSSDSFQVKGNANTVDGNKYQMGNKKVALDHNEVIMDTTDGNKFVFSDSLIDPKTNMSYAKLAAKHSKAKGEAEKVLAMPKTAYDEQAKSTVSQSNAVLNRLATQQEQQATMMGLRESDGSTKQAFQSGGTLPYEGFNVPLFQGWYNSISRPSTDMLVEDGKWGPKTAEAYRQFGANFSDDVSPIADQIRQLSRTEALRTPVLSIPSSREGLPLQITSQNQKVSGITGQVVPDISTLVPKVDNAATSDTAKLTNYKTPWTIGDALKGVELLSKGIGAFGKPEVEKAVTDNSPLTQQTFDPTNSLYQNRRAYSNYVNTLPATSLAARRALGSNALSNLYSSNNSVVSQYQAMNQQARQTYEDRLSNRRRFNAQQMTRANEVNSANRAAQDAVQQNFFTSIGQFGEDINRKRYAEDQVNLLGTQYRDVFENFLKTLQ